MKKNLLPILAAILCMALLTGCKGNAADPAEDTSLSASNPAIDTSTEYELLEDIVGQIRKKTDFKPKAALILGSGLNSLVDEMTQEAVIPYTDIKGLPVSTAPGHEGRFVFGYLEGVPVVVMQGRVHCYEGYSAIQVVRPVRVMKMLGAETLILTNSSGGVNTDFKGGEIMMITDHILYGVSNPLIGENISQLGDRFPDMNGGYDKDLQQFLRESAAEVGVDLKEGVYLQDTGPSYETQAETKLFRTIGADAVGMSTGIEAVAARHMGMKICGLSCVTVPPADMSTEMLNEDVVNSKADRMTEDLGKILKAFIVKIE